MSDEHSALEPSASPVEPASVDLLASALRADVGDLQVFERVLASSIIDMFPAGMIEVDYDKSMSDRLKGRSGTVTAIKVSLGDERLELVRERRGLVARISREVRGIVISTRPVDLEEWTRALAEGLTKLSAESQRAREALARILGTS